MKTEPKILIQVSPALKAKIEVAVKEMETTISSYARCALIEKMQRQEAAKTERKPA